METAPDLSVVLLTSSDSQVLRLSLAQLRRQTAAARMEVLLVAPSRSAFASETLDPRGLHSIRVVESARLASEGARKAAGVLAARAPLVAFVEDHSFPDRDWAEVVLSTHRLRDCALVAPVMGNANPARATSWACFLVFYGPCMAGQFAADLTHLPSNQCCYRKEALQEYGTRLAALLEAETLLHWDLRTRGLRLHREPAARVRHLNFSHLPPVTFEYFLASRCFAASRAAGWGLARRMVYAAGSGLLPLLRLVRLLGQARGARLRRWDLVRALPPALVILCAGAAGEMLGYSLGPGRAAEMLAAFLERASRAYTPEDLAQAAGLGSAG